MRNRRLTFEMRMAYERIGEIVKEYNSDLTKGRELVANVVYHPSIGTITIFFTTFAYHIFIYKDTYVLIWARRDSEDEHKWIHDGTEYCFDVSELCRSLNNRIFGGFSPRRGSLWYQFGLPEKRKRQNRKGFPA